MRENNFTFWKRHTILNFVVSSFSILALATVFSFPGVSFQVSAQTVGNTETEEERSSDNNDEVELRVVSERSSDRDGDRDSDDRDNRDGASDRDERDRDEDRDRDNRDSHRGGDDRDSDDRDNRDDDRDSDRDRSDREREDDRGRDRGERADENDRDRNRDGSSDRSRVRGDSFGSITILKEVVGHNVPERWFFNFVGDLGDFILTNEKKEFTAERLEANRYTISEDSSSEEDYDLINVSCDNPNSFSRDGMSIEVGLERGEDVTCTFTNLVSQSESDKICPAWALEPQSPKTADLTGDELVDGSDLSNLLESWGPCDDPGNCPSDLNFDGEVNQDDLDILLDLWGTSGDIEDPMVISPGSADLNNDGKVDGADLAILTSSWGPCDDPENCPSDLNNDGIVDECDLSILRAFWGNVDDGGDNGGGGDNGNNNGDNGGDNDGSGSSGGGGFIGGTGSGGSGGGQVLGETISEEQLETEALNLMKQLLQLLQTKLLQMQAQNLSEEQAIPEVLGEFAQAQEITEELEEESDTEELEEEIEEEVSTTTEATSISEEGDSGNRMWLWILLVIVLAILLYFTLRKRKA